MSIASLQQSLFFLTTAFSLVPARASPNRDSGSRSPELPGELSCGTVRTAQRVLVFFLFCSFFLLQLQVCPLFSFCRQPLAETRCASPPHFDNVLYVCPPLSPSLSGRGAPRVVKARPFSTNWAYRAEPLPLRFREMHRRLTEHKPSSRAIRKNQPTYSGPTVVTHCIITIVNASLTRPTLL